MITEPKKLLHYWWLWSFSLPFVLATVIASYLYYCKDINELTNPFGLEAIQAFFSCLPFGLIVGIFIGLAGLFLTFIGKLIWKFLKHS